MIIDAISIEITNLSKQIELIKSELALLPQQRLLCEKTGRYYTCYQRDSGGKKYLSKKKDKKIITQLARARYLSLQLEDYTKKLDALRHCHSDIMAANKSDLILTTPGYGSLIRDSMLHGSSLCSSNLADSPETAQLWAHESFHANPYHPEGLIHPTPSGNMVRSKSEVLIATILYAANIAFRYEAELVLGSHTFYPDFTIMHPRTGKIFYWEHFGMMDNEDYHSSALAKTQQYFAHGIYPGANLILTYETSESPLSILDIEKLAGCYLT